MQKHYVHQLPLKIMKSIGLSWAREEVVPKTISMVGHGEPNSSITHLLIHADDKITDSLEDNHTAVGMSCQQLIFQKPLIDSNMLPTSNDLKGASRELEALLSNWKGDDERQSEKQKINLKICKRRGASMQRLKLLYLCYFGVISKEEGCSFGMPAGRV